MYDDPHLPVSLMARVCAARWRGAPAMTDSDLLKAILGMLLIAAWFIISALVFWP